MYFFDWVGDSPSVAMAALHSSNSMGPNETKGGRGKKKKNSFRFIWHRKGQWPTAANAVNVHHAMVAHTYTRGKHTLATAQQAVWRAIPNSVHVCVCTQTGTVGAVPEGRRGQWQSQLCVWWPSQRSGAPSWGHKAPAPESLAHTHTHTRSESGETEKASRCKTGGIASRSEEQRWNLDWRCGTRTHALTLLHNDKQVGDYTQRSVSSHVLASSNHFSWQRCRQKSGKDTLTDRSSTFTMTWCQHFVLLCCFFPITHTRTVIALRPEISPTLQHNP